MFLRDEYIPVVSIDATLPVDDIDVDIVDRVSALEPYGMGNSTPHIWRYGC